MSLKYNILVNLFFGLIDLFFGSSQRNSKTCLAIFYVTIEILMAVGVVAGVYMLGAGFAERLKHAFEWQPLHHNRALE